MPIMLASTNNSISDVTPSELDVFSMLIGYPELQARIIVKLDEVKPGMWAHRIISWPEGCRQAVKADVMDN